MIPNIIRSPTLDRLSSRIFTLHFPNSLQHDLLVSRKPVMRGQFTLLPRIHYGIHLTQNIPADMPNLPDIVRQLEEKLFSDAASQEEYLDMSTLERRLQIAVKNLKNPTSTIQNAASQPQHVYPSILIKHEAQPPAVLVNMQRGNDLAVAGEPAGSSTADSRSDVNSFQLHTVASNMMSNGAPVLLRNGCQTGTAVAHQLGLEPPRLIPLQTAAEAGTFIPNMIPNGSIQLPLPEPALGTSGGGVMLSQGPSDPSQSGGGTVQDPATARSEQSKLQVLKQQRWLLFLRHCAKCTLPESECTYGGNCTVAKQLWQHLSKCRDSTCLYPRCKASRDLLHHHQKCQSTSCPVCVPVKQYVSQQRQLALQRKVGALAPEHRQIVYNTKAQHFLVSQASDGHLVSANAPIIDTHAAKRPRTYHQHDMGTSLVEYFTAGEIELHLAKLKSSTVSPLGARTRVFTLDAFQNFEDENSCKVCGLNRLTFEPPSLYCFCCGQRIKRNQTFYTTPPTYEVKGVWCHPCFNDIRGESFVLDGYPVRKIELIKKKNDDEVEESWVQCDRCQGWVHQICGLFNKGRNDEDRGFLCPSCLLHGLQRGERSVPTERPQAMLSARDLPACDLSDKLEARIEQKLAEERLARAKMLGLPLESVPTAEGLTVRVVNNVMKRCEVKSRFFDTFKSDGFPEAFLYRQKVILLFQRIDGADIAIFCLYLQEYDDDCGGPNSKKIYLSYLDSIKYFQPENVVAATSGTALRTFVYHELLLGYLADAKERGYCQMLIWACPPLQGDDYILYCHPGKQKTPRSDRLREWYHAMLRGAKIEGTVTYVSNLFDTYFEGGKDHFLDNLSITHLPYFDGDYWPGEAENLLANFSEDCRQAAAGMPGSKGRKGKGKRFSGVGTVDNQVLGALGDAIQGMREDFLILHLQENCSYCRGYISGEDKFYHPNPPSKIVIKSERTFDGISLDRPGGESSRTITMTRFQLCPRCYAQEREPSEGVKARGLPAGINLVDLIRVPCPVISQCTDTVGDLENEFFETRQAFLSLCQGNHYQFDSLRRAKHSSMMVLYHLHNPTAAAFSATCNVCNAEIASGEGYRCNVCPDFDMCNKCFNNPQIQHPHALQPHTRAIDETRTRLTVAEAAERGAQLRRTMLLLVHASACNDKNCPSTNCAKVKALFNHAMTCSVKIAGGCQFCRRMWALLQAHAKSCTLSNCPVPRCQELRGFRRQQAARMEDQRRAAYRAMLEKQQAGG